MRKAVRFSIDISLLSFALLLLCIPVAGGLYLRSSDHFITMDLGVRSGALAIWAAEEIEWHGADPEKIVAPGGLPEITDGQVLYILRGGRSYCSINAMDSRHEPEKLEEAMHAVAVRALANQKRETGLISGRFLYVAQPFLDEGQRSMLVLLSSRQRIFDYKDSIRSLILETSFLSLIFAFVIASLFHVLVTKPLKVLANQAAAAVTAEKGNSIVLSGKGRPDEIGLLARSFEASLTCLLEKNEAIAAFTSDVVHELKNPLAGIRASLELLARDPVLKDSSLISTALKENARAESLLYSIRELGNLDREPSGRCSPKLLLEQLNSYYELVGSVDFQIVNLAEKACVAVSEDRLGRALRNLIDNALDYSPRDRRVQVVVDAASSPGAEKLIIHVNDRGPGIDRVEAEKIFFRFYSTRKNDQTGKHSGLGLSIARSIILAGQGSLEYQDRVGGGASFIVRLPLI